MDWPTRRIMAFDRLDAKIKAAAGDEPLLKELQLRRAKISERVARELLDLGPGANFPDDDPSEVYDTGGRDIYPFFKVTGNPSKKGRPMAEEWMRQRNVEWDGSTKSLRREVVQALFQAESVPNFGLGIQLTVEIR